MRRVSAVVTATLFSVALTTRPLGVLDDLLLASRLLLTRGGCGAGRSARRGHPVRRLR